MIKYVSNTPRFLSKRAIEYLIDNALQRSGIRKPGEVHLTHGFRKFFITQCESSQMKPLHVSMLSGHDTGIYHIPNKSVVLEDFMTHAVDALTIDPKQRSGQENAELSKSQNDYLAELGDLREDFNEMKQFLVNLDNKNTQVKVC